MLETPQHDSSCTRLYSETSVTTLRRKKSLEALQTKPKPIAAHTEVFSPDFSRQVLTEASAPIEPEEYNSKLHVHQNNPDDTRYLVNMLRPHSLATSKSKDNLRRSESRHRLNTKAAPEYSSRQNSLEQKKAQASLRVSTQKSALKTVENTNNRININLQELLSKHLGYKVTSTVSPVKKSQKANIRIETVINNKSKISNNNNRSSAKKIVGTSDKENSRFAGRRFVF